MIKSTVWNSGYVGKETRMWHREIPSGEKVASRFRIAFWASGSHPIRFLLLTQCCVDVLLVGRGYREPDLSTHYWTLLELEV